MTRRVKTYSAETGFVYQYVFVTQRRARRGWFTRGAEYIFSVSADRKNDYPVAVFLADQAVARWERSHGRELSPTERYAAAKIRLLRAFDETERLDAAAARVDIDAEKLEELLASLDIA